MLLVACDGVFDVFDNQEVVVELLKIDQYTDKNIAKREEAISVSLINLAVDNGSTDNVSSIVISLT